MQNRRTLTMRPCLILLLLFFLYRPGLPAQSLFDSVRVARSAELYFASGSSALDSAALSALDSLVAFFRQSRRAEDLRITAYTDSVGQTAFNLALSERRAATVRAALEARGAPPDKISVAFFGENRPAAPNATENGRRRNRRATVEARLRIPMTTLSGHIKDQETGRGIAANVVFTHKTWSDSIATDTSGRYAVRVPENIPVKVEAFAEGYFFESVLRRTYGSETLVRKSAAESDELRLRPARPGEKAVLKEFYFVGGQDVLLEVSKPQLPNLLKFMQLNPALNIEIGGHINAPYGAMHQGRKIRPGEMIDDNHLSERRARLVYDYLVENGIAAERLRWKGYGNTQMIHPQGRTEEEQEQNRRVEIRVLGKDQD